jgi:hypothetical protein
MGTESITHPTSEFEIPARSTLIICSEETSINEGKEADRDDSYDNPGNKVKAIQTIIEGIKYDIFAISILCCEIHQ